MHRRRILWLLPGVILVAGLIVVLLFAKPAAPKILDLYAGPEGSTYYQYAQQYAAFLAERGITARIRVTAGSIENLRILAATDQPAATFALSGVDRGLKDVAGIENLESLGCLSFQPFWMFVAADSEISSPEDLVGGRVALGQADSDSRAVARMALAANGVLDQIEEATDVELTDHGLAAALVRGDLDAVFLVGVPHSRGVSALLEAEGVEAVSFRRIDTYTRLHPEVGQVVVPEGLYDLARNLPDSDLQLVAPADNLVVRADIHPALMDLFLDAAAAIHREPTLFGDRGTFPNMRHTSLPLSAAAVRFYEQGPPVWRQYLPYWLASLVDRFALIVAQVGAAVLLLIKGGPALLRLRFTTQSMALYKKMEALERELMAGADWEETMAGLRGLQDQVSALVVPRMVLTDYLELRQNLHDLRERMELWRQESHAS